MIDMSAMKLIEDARKEGLKITSFTSFCGGLPAPEISNGPLGYKFSSVSFILSYISGFSY